MIFAVVPHNWKNVPLNQEFTLHSHSHSYTHTPLAIVHETYACTRLKNVHKKQMKKKEDNIHNTVNSSTTTNLCECHD